MEKIRKEVERRREASPKETPREVLRIGSRMEPREPDRLGTLDRLLWKYGIRYAKRITRVPLLRKIAERQYVRLVSIPNDRGFVKSYGKGKDLGLGFLERNWYYYDFFEQAKREGLKGRVKLLILRSLGFFAWWQGQINRSVVQVLADLAARDTDLSRAIEGVRDELSQMRDHQSHLTDELNRLSNQMRDHKLNLLEHEKRLTLSLQDARRPLPEPLAAGQTQSMMREEVHRFDIMYLAFEDRFRGTREEIKDRLKVYLPYLEGARAGGAETRILDLGCGRGEWLEICRENHLDATGVDLNQAMVSQCLELGFHVIEGDVISVLLGHGANSLGAITGFHLIEHLSFNRMMDLFDEAFRVLRPGGIVILETPNPENVLVASCNFYIDPTHKTPLVPEAVKFLAEQRGFARTEILRLNRRGEPRYMGQQFVDEVIHRFNMEQDYAFIGYKE
jgi:SAM-dependent methyltransferase